MRGLSRQDFIIGAIDRIAVRKGIGRDAVRELMVSRAGLTRNAADNLSAHWFSEQYRHGGIEFRRAEYLQRRKAFGVEGLRPVEAPAILDAVSALAGGKP